MSRTLAIFRLILLYLFISSVVLLLWFSYERTPRQLTIAFLDVGQGDAIFIQSPTGKQALIDGGIDRGILSKLARVMPFFDRSLDVVIGTHPDKDHIGGLPYVLERYRVANVLDPGLEDTTETYTFYQEEVKEEVEKGGALYREARRGNTVDLGDGAYLRVLFPDRSMDGTSDTNNASIVMQLVYGQTEVMLMGDAPKSIEQYLVMLDSTALESDILKAGHHGSRTSSGEVFVKTISPDYAIISAGCDNSYGHPHEETIEVLTAASTTILSTCEQGTIVFTSDGATLKRK